MDKLLYIALGGGVGAVARHLLTGLAQRTFGTSFPFGTLAVNVLGCFAMGTLGALFAGPLRVREELRLALLVGLLGGFTTFSSYAWEVFTLAEGGERGRALAHLLLNNGLCLAAVWLGFRLVLPIRAA